MLLKILQDNRDLFSAHFDIAYNNETAGEVIVNGSLSSLERNIEVRVSGGLYSLSRTNKYKSKGCRSSVPYEITDSGNRIGTVFYASEKRGFLKSIDYFRASVFEKEYQMYTVGLGEEGIKYPIYCNGTQIAMLRRPPVIIDDRFDFELIVRNEEDVFISVLLMSYLYGRWIFQPGKMKNGTVHFNSVTIDEELLSKYDSTFEKKYQ